MIKNTTTFKCISNSNIQMQKKKKEKKRKEEPSNVIILNLRSQLKTHSKMKDLQKNKGS